MVEAASNAPGSPRPLTTPSAWTAPIGTTLSVGTSVDQRLAGVQDQGVPLAALARDGERYAVTLADGKKRTVRIGQTSTSMAEVLEGLKVGDAVLEAPARPR